MDNDPNRLIFDPTFAPISAQAPRTPRKRPRPSDGPQTDPAKLQEKREKARERQRRKRERDRRRDSNATALAAATFPGGPNVAGPSNPVQQQQQQQQQDQQQQQQPGQLPQQLDQPGQPPQDGTQNPNLGLTQEEYLRREKVRAAARDRQRKHRALVKQKKMAELGLAMGTDGMGGLEEMHYALGPDGQYQPVLPPAPPHDLTDPNQPFPQGHTGGQTFASTLLLSFSCSPLLKQHLLRTLHMTNEELASLEPILSAAWDQWDHARRIHYAEQAAKAGADPNGAGPSNPVNPFGVDAQAQAQAQVQANPNDFRARFARPLTAPSPFRNTTAPMPGMPGMPIPVGGGPSQIDPSLSGVISAAIQNGLQAAQAVAAATGTTAIEGEGEDGSASDDVDMGEDKEEAEVANGLSADAAPTAAT